MISKRNCPHTRVVNFFASGDPLIAIGSVSEMEAEPRRIWWSPRLSSKRPSQRGGPLRRCDAGCLVPTPMHIAGCRQD